MNKLIFAAICITSALSVCAAELKLSLQAYTFRDRSFVETLETAARLGYQNIEAYPGQRLGGPFEGTTDYKTITPDTLAELKAYLAKVPVKVVSYGVTGAADAAEWTKLTDFCQTLGIGQIQIEVGATEETLKLAESFAVKTGVRVSLHNHRQEEGRPERVAVALQKVGPAVGAGSDIGHWQNAEIDPLGGVKLLKGRFHTLHAIDMTADKHEVAFGAGVIDLKAIFDQLAQNETGTIYVTVEDERQRLELERDVAACAAWFAAWKNPSAASVPAPELSRP